MKRNEICPLHLTYYELRALLFWATVGVRKSEGGSYYEAAENEGDEGVINSIANGIKFKLPAAPRFKGRQRLCEKGKK